ncbi:hypothetical protein Vadar_028737 [Vaccinium darrowii]|uniref:Uncharacterized protein n=1 Tax=Vaccinium darrowii TaxID=229202 RepID=A0ACB7XCV9_9ERIC|nr:hypothetical protein Vadar_028737 [Vaccinium darrowii]
MFVSGIIWVLRRWHWLLGWAGGSGAGGFGGGGVDSAAVKVVGRWWWSGYGDGGRSDEVVVVVLQVLWGGEKIQSNYARIVVVVWLFLAVVLTQSYTASLTSMLTIQRLKPKILSLAKIGIDDAKFMKKYVQDVLNYKNVDLISDEDGYLREFESGNITAAFLEIPYAKVFVNKYCRKFTIIGTTYRFGGFGFIFQKDCRLAADVSKAILQISEDGTLRKLEEEWLTPNKECLDSQTTMENVDSLSLRSFWGLFLISVTTSSISFLLFLGHLIKNYWHHQSSPVANIDASNESISIKTVRVARYLMNADIGSPWRSSPSSDPAAPETEIC